MPYYLTTRNGYARLQKRLQAALEAYEKVCGENSHAARDGDTSVWHDNFAYEHNQREMHRLSRRIVDIKNILTNVKVVAPPPSPKKVQVGSVVTLHDLEENQEWQFEIAGYEDGDIDQQRISYNAPIIQRIIDGKKGDKYELFLDGRNRDVVITAIRGEEGAKRKDQ